MSIRVGDPFRRDSVSVFARHFLFFLCYSYSTYAHQCGPACGEVELHYFRGHNAAKPLLVQEMAPPVLLRYVDESAFTFRMVQAPFIAAALYSMTMPLAVCWSGLRASLKPSHPSQREKKSVFTFKFQSSTSFHP